MAHRPTDRYSVVLLQALDNAWQPLAALATTLSEDEYRWEPVAGCWTVRERDGEWHADWEDPDPVPAPVTTIAWRCWHIAVDCLDSYSRHVVGRTGTGLTGTRWVVTSVEATDALTQSFDVFRSAVAGWTEEELLRTLGPSWGPFAEHSLADLALHATREIVHHAAEISLLRDLHRSQR